ncbi:hypothetical protein EO087_08475 [Dyella sp. M7H15-1]|uniref:hypothetical protein n=1 Tax=Dyella sp. M7H15-1 TaxID=2501295 RepID=UPI001004F04C|nr:hypothetical protein [Dyella sp. M7H15-1]QAU24023.1 hypothetical protein EO087_08475 [Dyella sp. M7H15-1]
MLLSNKFPSALQVRLAAGIATLAASFALPMTTAIAQTVIPEQSTQYNNSLEGAFGHGMTVIPRSASDCNPNPLYAIQQCTQVIGAGLEINSISGTGINWDDYELTELHIEIYGPNGTIANCDQFNLPAYATSPTCTWNNPDPKKQMTAGDYCSRTWMYDGSGYIDMDSECIDVHS